MQTGYVDIIPGTGFIIHQDIWATIDEELHANSEELGIGLQELVIQKTPFRTGALQGDLSYEAYNSPGGYGIGQSDLVWIYAQDIGQLLQWRRIYAQYQEGDPLGVPTYTNAPREMFFLTATTDGLALIAAWANVYANLALLRCVMGTGVPF